MKTEDLIPGQKALCEHCGITILDDYGEEITHDLYLEIVTPIQSEIDLLCYACEDRVLSVLDIDTSNINEWMSREFDEVMYGTPNTIQYPSNNSNNTNQ